MSIPYNSAGHHVWSTPQDFYDQLDAEFHFTLDPCCNDENAKCLYRFTEKDDGLKQDWSTHTVFMNPPYGRLISKWVKKAYEESTRGVTVVCLLPARTDTRWWWDYCIKYGEIRFIKGRLKFKGKNKDGVTVNMPATFPSAVVIFKGHEKEERI